MFIFVSFITINFFFYKLWRREFFFSKKDQTYPLPPSLKRGNVDEQFQNLIINFISQTFVKVKQTNIISNLMTETRRTQYDGQKIKSSLSGWATRTNKEEVRLDNQHKLKTSDTFIYFPLGLVSIQCKCDVFHYD